jgi:hypothetical protein
MIAGFRKWGLRLEPIADVFALRQGCYPYRPIILTVVVHPSPLTHPASRGSFGLS